MISVFRCLSFVALLGGGLALAPTLSAPAAAGPQLPAPRAHVALQVWPNPALVGQRAHLHLTGLGVTSGSIAIRVRSATSTQILMEQEVAAAASVDVAWSLENYTPGVYLVEVSCASGPLAVKLLVR